MSPARPRLRTPLVLALGAALALPLALTAPRPAVAAGASVTPLKFTVDAGGKRCTIDADLYRPAGVDAAHPAPAVMTTNGFGGSKTDGSTDTIAEAFAARGYVALAYSGLGFGKTGCPISLDAPAIDGRAASGLIDFLGGKRAADDGTRAGFVTLDRAGDPRLGMIGGSYGGAIQLATASRDPRIDALVPLVTWHDLGYSLVPNTVGGAQDVGAAARTPGVYKYQWTNAFFLIGEAQGLLHPSLDQSRLGGAGCTHFVARACDMKRLFDSARFPKARTDKRLRYARQVSPASYLDTVRAPTLLIQGQADTLFTLNEAEATYRRLTARGVTARMIWQSWGHSDGINAPAPGELDLAKGNLETSYVGRRVLAWFDRYLRHDTRAAAGPALAYYRDWATDGGHPYASADGPPATGRTLYLSGDGKLVGTPAAAGAGSRSYLNLPVATSHSENSLAGMTGQPNPAPYDGKGTYLGWTSNPLAAPLDVVGSPEATLKVTSSAAERVQGSSDAANKLVLFAKIYDVAPDGTASLVHRLIAPVRVPDVRRPFEVTLPGIVHRFAEGHRLRFVVAASDDAYYGNTGTKRVTVSGTAGTPAGTLRLPVDGG
ncbi:CocE/NonD family hydrolase [Streptomyces tsukubensis]|uniref:CocE/NonD family hydrolase n=1 Tax=Streptomyces tsukubensis TaxID=83656 RepID=UPI00098F43B5|nr:CocE/NonD family hydrolase [Streptomyces tsukubensis]QFR96525.1 CocE/NonD family hydrolase [Streptomyces tsukubensis]